MTFHTREQLIEAMTEAIQAKIDRVDNCGERAIYFEAKNEGTAQERGYYDKTFKPR